MAKEKATKVTTKKALKPAKTIKSEKPSIKANVAKKTIGKADLDDMFRAAVAKNESFEIDENADYGDAIIRFNDVIKYLDTVISIDPTHRDAINYKGMMLVGCGRNADAIEYFDRIIKMNPADKEALNNKGIALYGLGKDAEALKCVESAIALDKRYGDAFMNKAVILNSMGKTEDAKVCLARANALYAILG